MATNIQATTAQISVLAQADPNSVVETFRRLGRYRGDGRWLAKANVYGTDTVDRIRTDRQGNQINGKHLAEYISASTVLHMADGWGFLGRAMQAHLIGDYAVARHLSYYAELRAAMSILACNGVGVFSGWNYVLTGPRSVVEVAPKSPTHQFTWAALHWWAQSQGPWNLIGDSVRPYGVPVGDWLSLAPGYSAWGAVASGWVTSLGLDIQRVADDQESRNIASYRPNRLMVGKKASERDDVSFAVDLWRSLEPSVTGFSLLDIHILRITLERAFEGVEGKKPRNAPADFEHLVDTVIGQLSDESARQRAKKFLLRKTESEDHTVFAYAALDTEATDPQHHLQLMSRSALLLALATSSCRLLVERAGLSLRDHEFWWNALGTDRGIWTTAPPSEDLRDLWEDINVELEDAESWVAGGASTRVDFIEACPRAFSRLSYFELVALWGIPA